MKNNRPKQTKREEEDAREEAEGLFSGQLTLRIVWICFNSMFVTISAFLGILFLLVHAKLVVFIGINIYIIGIIGLCSIVAGTVLSAVIIRRYLNPIHKISKASTKVAKGDFTVIVKDPCLRKEDDEVSTLIQNFNAMVQELGKMEMLKNDFVANVSHEMKTPLSTIQGYATLLQDPTLSEEERNNYTSLIIESSKRLTTLTQNILKLSRLENQTLVIQQSTFSLDEQIRQSILSYEKQWTEKDLELDIDLEPMEITTDEDLLYTVWTNLIGNAVKFSQPGGYVGVKSYRAGEYVVTEISDHGPGIPLEELGHIFDKFYQGDSSHTKEGNGLGLALVKRILVLLQGEISADSVVGKGSTFTVKVKSI